MNGFPIVEWANAVVYAFEQEGYTPSYMIWDGTVNGSRQVLATAVEIDAILVYRLATGRD